MATIKDILGEEPQSVESILGQPPMVEEAVKRPVLEGQSEREQFLRDQYEATGEMYPIGKETPLEIPAEIRAIPPTLWELAKTQIPGIRLFSEEFKQSAWWLKKEDLPPEFDNQEFTAKDWVDWYKEFKKTAPITKQQVIGEEVTSLASFFMFPTQMKMLGELVGPPIQKFAPKLYNLMTKEIKLGKIPTKIPEKEIKPEVKQGELFKPTEKVEIPTEQTWYHGTTKEFEEFLPEKMRGGLKVGPGFYFTDNPEYAGVYAKGEGANIRPQRLNVSNPMNYNRILKSPTEQEIKIAKEVLEDHILSAGSQVDKNLVKTMWEEIGKGKNPVHYLGGEDLTDFAKRLGYDAITHTEGTGAKVMVVFNKSQIEPIFKPKVPIEEKVPPRNIEGEKAVLETEGPFETTVKYDPHQAMAEAGTENMIAKGIERDPKKLMTEQLIEEWLADPKKYENIIAKYGMTPQEWAGLMREQASSWGRKLGELGLESQRLGREIPEIAEAMDELAQIARGSSAWDKIQTGWKNIDRVRRGLLVTQLSTAMRNGFSQLGRVGMDIPEKAMNFYLAKLFGMQPKGSPLDGVEQLLKVVQRGESKKIAETVLEQFPKQYTRLYSTYMSDIEVGKVGQTISRGVDILNTLNRSQEFLFRNGVFSATLEQELKKGGMDLIKIIESRKFTDIPKEVVEKSVSKALEMTFAETPKYGTIGKKFVDFVTSFPGATFVLPFPRFMINSLKFNFEYSPLGILKLLSSAERTAFASGDVHVLSRAIMGTTMLGTAWQMRNSEFAGEKWNELKVGGKTINMMPYNPFAVYLFVADVIKKSNEGSLYKLTGKDVSMGVLSSNVRAGTGLYAMDQVTNILSRTGDPQKVVDILKTTAGEAVGGLFTPLNQVKELLAGFDDYIVKEKRQEPFMGPIKERIPFVEKTLPVLYSATREGPVTRELSAMRQMTGVMVKTKNPFEKELDRLGFSYQEIFHSTGNPEADNLVKKYMGIMATNMVIPMVESKDYKSLTEGQKGLALANLLNEVRNTAKEAAEEENPKLFATIKLGKTPQRQRIVLEEEGIDIKELQKQLTQ